MSIEFCNGISLEDDNPTVKRYHVSNLPEGIGAATLDEPISVQTILGELTIVAAKRLANSSLVHVIPDRVNPEDIATSSYGAHLRARKNQQHLARLAAMNKPVAQSEADKKARELAMAKNALNGSAHSESYRNLIDQLRKDPELIKAYYSREDDALKDISPADFEGATVAVRSTAVLPNGVYVSLIDRVKGTANQFKVRASYAHFALIVGNPFDGSEPQVYRQTTTQPELDVYRGSGTFLRCAEFQPELPGPFITANFTDKETVISTVRFGDEEPQTDLVSARQLRLLSGVEI